MKYHIQNQLNRIRAFNLLLVLIAAILWGCQSPDSDGVSKGGKPPSEEPGPSIESKKPNEISVMTFNVENMFNASHDVGTEDFAYLPLKDKSAPEVQAFCKTVGNPFYREECFTLDWSDEVVKFKYSQVGKVIRHVERGAGPDVVLVQEVENDDALRSLFQKELADLKYQTVVLIEGFDLRGIDVGVVSKFPLSKTKPPQLHRIPFSDPKASRSRGILEVTLDVAANKPITFLSAHFPSQSNPTIWRKEAHTFAAKLMKDYESQGRAVIFGGDLNTTKEEDEENGYISEILASAGSISHLAGCKKCKGSHNHKGTWGFLDMIVFGRGLEKIGYTLDVDSVDIVRAPVHLRPDGTPKRFNSVKREGVADHLPVYARLKAIPQN